MPATFTPAGAASSAGEGLEVNVEVWQPENWLSYPGDLRLTVGAVMVPTILPKGGRAPYRAEVTVVAARYEPGFEWDDGQSPGRTQLGFVTGNVSAELAGQVAYSIPSAETDEAFQHVVLCAMSAPAVSS